jgi:type IV pilus assembly protein PilE
MPDIALNPVPSLPKRRPTDRGLSLVELMVVMVIVGVLAVLIAPSFQQMLYKGRRPDAQAALATMQLAQERVRGTSTTYEGTLANLTGATAATSPQGLYSLSIVAGSATASAYTLRATAATGAKQENDASCQIFEVAMNNGTISYRSYASGGGQNGTPDPCWAK